MVCSLKNQVENVTTLLKEKTQQFDLLQHWFNNLEEQNLKLIQEF